MGYAVKEIYYTLQGEGVNAGRPAVFCRFAGCNLWSGHEKDRGSAMCNFCDTDFVGTDGPGGGRFESARALAKAVAGYWPAGNSGRIRPLLVCTGGEPLLQLDADAVSQMQDCGFEVAIETNGTLLPPPRIDWICVSPKRNSKLIVRTGHELKLVFPQADVDPEQFAALDFEYFLLQPMDGVNQKENTLQAIRYCLDHPQWRLSLQTHKLLGLP